MMPGMDGFGLLKRLRADGVDAPVLFLTAKDAVEDKISGLTLARTTTSPSRSASKKW